MKNPLLTAAILLLMASIKSQTISPIIVCNLPSAVNESSGIEKTAANSFWTHNDSGGLPRVYNFDSSGTLVRTIDVTNATNIDWEDVAFGETGSFYIGDFGNNSNNRSVANGNPLRIYIIQNLDVIVGSTTTAGILQFEYEDRNFSAPAGNHNFDMEGFFFYDDSLHLFTKNRTSPSNGWIKHYILPAQTGTYTAELIDSFNNTGIRITAADMSPDHRTIALLAQDRIYLVSCFNNSRFFETGYVDTYVIPNTQKEAIVFADNNNVFITDEGASGKLYRSNLDIYIASSLAVSATVQTTCVGDSSGSVLVTTSGGTPSFLYSWSNGNTTGNNNNLPGGTYLLIITDNHGCLFDTAFTVVTVSPPTATATNTGPYCSGDTIQLNSVGGFVTDDWAGPLSYTATNSQNPSIIAADTSMNGNYTVTVTNAAGCTSTSSTNVIVNDLPVVSITTNSPICSSDTLFLNSAGGIDYDWEGPNLYAQNNMQSPIIFPVTSFHSGIYTVTVTDVDGCSATSTITALVNPLPVVPVINQSGDTLFATPGAGYIFQWYMGGNPIVNDTASMSIVNQTAGYYVEITDSNGCTSASNGFNYASTVFIEVNINADFQVFPNPNDGNFNVVASEEFDLCIYDMKGAIVLLKDHLSPNGYSLNLSSISDGTYTMVIVIHGESYSIKVVKK